MPTLGAAYRCRHIGVVSGPAVENESVVPGDGEQPPSTGQRAKHPGSKEVVGPLLPDS